MKTSELRAAMKAIDPEIRVSGQNDPNGVWQITTNNHLDQVRAALAGLGLRESRNSLDIKGRWNWVYILTVLPAEVNHERPL